MTNIELDVARTTCMMNRAVTHHLEEIDCEQRRYEIAKECMAAFINRSANHAYPTERLIASKSVACADALIAELKKKGE